MAISTASLSEIRDQIVSDIESKGGFTIPVLSKAVWYIWGFALAGIWMILYKYGSDAYKQRFAQTASRRFLILLGELIGVTIQPETIWEGQGQVVSTTATGNLEAGTQLVNNNTGVVYTVSVTIPKSIGTMTVDLVSTQGGDISDLQIGDILDFISPQPGLANTCTISAVTTAGEDEEDLETYRQRVINGYQKKPQGGAEADYEAWALEAPNVINAYPYAATDPGKVDIYIEVDNQPDGIPTIGQLTATEDYILYDPVTGKKTRRPVTAEPVLKAITRKAFDVTILALSPDTGTIRAAIEEAISANLIGKAPYLQGLTITRNDTISDSEITSVVQSVISDYAATVSEVTVYDSGTPVDNYVLQEGEKAKSGTVSYV